MLTPAASVLSAPLTRPVWPIRRACWFLALSPSQDAAFSDDLMDALSWIADALSWIVDTLVDAVFWDAVESSDLARAGTRTSFNVPVGLLFWDEA